MAEEAKLRAEALLGQAERTVGVEGSPAAMQRAEANKTKAVERLVIAQAQLDRVEAEGKAKIDAAKAAREEARIAEIAKVAAQNEAKLAQAKTAPVSVFISRKTQKLYVRQAFQPLFESSVAISDPDTPIGTTIFTALNYTDGDADVRWSAISMYPDAGNREPAPSLGSRLRTRRDAEPAATDVEAAKAVLDRITIPQGTIDLVNESISPGSSLVISDEVMSRETGKGTDFVVLISGEPQGGITIRRRNPIARARFRYDGSFRHPDPGVTSAPLF